MGAENSKTCCAEDEGAKMVETLVALQPFNAGNNVFVVNLQRSSGEKLGVEMRPAQGRFLEVVAIKEGMLKTWNGLHDESRRVKHGDGVVGVNGIVDDSDGMLEELKTASTLKVMFAAGLFPLVIPSSPRKSDSNSNLPASPRSTTEAASPSAQGASP
mmetsp:Transcript_58320/g.103621  ORF Transcript_58320/g.103621 Transcript_58320/m.103621 type:complete len:158 (+) Transcript_58320:70-543(+)|eukprot:CAMPEP_0197664450 /NCGR_PEP_ID=MMETSP1338-20131121/58642_1 /TAXON_ID=43686 ORGANISM="Pelagodinium beii, Strain RCC1491" /NCGR_SAMPLE_ID=MMETSP1338 /ASSEMBLY_ACC=CAM_ASM_000754 /LENGTH=157 /DNA_ID=CAMNT_0043243085 /DNA_START=67 /DNA_END=540 /DNA_ORIENTATION=-